MFELFPGNYVWNLSINIALNSGAQLNELVDACRPIIPLATSGDAGTEAYLAAFEGLGDRISELAAEDLANGRTLSAATKYERAATYYITGERMQRVGYEPRVAVYQKMLDAFALFMKYGEQPVERVEIAFDGSSFPALFYRAPNAGPKTPVIVHFNGLDSTKEMMWGSPLRIEFAKRGISTLMVDHPGTGEALRLRGQKAIVESERWGSACIDYLETRDDVDLERIGILGWSLGGYYAPRAAAFEKRFALCVAMGANYNWGELQAKRAKREGENPVPHYWEHVEWVWGKPTFEEFMRFAPQVSLEGVVEQITVPLLVTHGANDRQIPLEYAHQQFDAAINSPKRELHIFTEREGGVEHVGGDNILPAASFIPDWVAESF
ncbi:alpha/beta hydrolase family protein [Subtercola lobariae]|uniref:Alpha/beta hydrolase n=1 Tax=Subtercola lobariae TaxID=1588641 RepID=A0A917EXX1_9MICO|nr:alpha/beta fold hydrolase [Subtercola lobariae]GGF30500.1 alpha/beta hydrolase [Subtercola lobariae]